MCGIGGFIGNHAPAVAEAMAAVMPHRGPDGIGLWIDPDQGIHLVHRRLSIVDLGTGNQPMWDETGEIGIVFNGEIYNHTELRQRLIAAGHVFRTDHSDTEVVIQGYKAWGPDVVEQLNGMWAFAILDRRRGQLFLSRDRFGEKPLYFHRRDGLFAFGSELRVLLAHPAIRPATSPLAVQKYFAHGYLPAPHTIYQGIEQLPAGHSAIYDLAQKSLRVSRYWSLVIDPQEPASPDRAEAQYGEAIRELLGRSVRQRMVADVPVGILLSGGVDSSAIAYFASRGSEPITSFNIGFEEKSFDESSYAREVAQLTGARHIVERLSLSQASHLLPELLDRLDEPLADASLLPCYLLFRHVGRHMKVALGGDGGDELFAGYDTFRALRWAKLYESVVPRPLRRPIRLVAGMLPVSHRNMSLDFKIKRTLRGLDYNRNMWNAAWLGPLSPQELGELMTQRIDLDEVYSEALSAWNACPQENLVDKTMQFYVNLYLQNDILTKVDRSSMMHSVECRAPFLDLDLVNYVRRIPSRFKLRGDRTKHILKVALEPLLPDHILNRPKKGFGVPIGKWFADGELSADSSSVLHSYLDCNHFAQLAKEHRQEAADHRAVLWAGLVLDRYLSRPTRMRT
ncbi:asparagine synthase (glutamine-hydrolyzing) [Dongia soli]|uniref:asparagine synthase (glutamine-hydrolyzing) n=1 Tax=Dongia soli TaxID=600628 RepID=A0ABU5EDX4_9PROT|nr:asparagine synthase (glutamine-hydrolyzing) [Dongia soli]MDY0884061.1 asparagine synthase (glutamine-hydrolyzing) [Dongia soli]